MFSKQKVLVAGGTGFIGVNLIERLLSLGAKVRATIHKNPKVLHDDRIEYISCDLSKMADCITATEGMDYVFLCAANTSGAAVMQNTPLVHVTPNLLINSQMLEASYFADIKKFIWISSGAAYPPTGERPVSEEEFFDGDPHDKYYPVAWMKRYTEILCRMYSEKLPRTMSTTVVRPSNVFGPYDDFNPETSHVTAALIRKVVERQNPLEVWGTGEDVRDLIYIDDFIDGLLLATQKIEGYDPVNIVSGQGYSVKELLQLILDVDSYSNVEIQFNTSKPSTMPIRLIDNSKAKKKLGFEAKTNIMDALSRTIDWFRTQNKLAS